jgi:cytoskeleton protein RodZ
MRGVSLDEVATATKINTRFLEALENGRWGELPGGAFGRGFVRAAARFLGLNEDDMVAEFALETGGGAQSKPAPELSGAMPRNYQPAIAAAAIFIVVLIVGGWFAHREISIHRHKRAELAVASGAQASPGTSGGTSAETASDSAGAPAAAPAPAADSSPSVAASSGVPSGAPDGAAPAVGAPAPGTSPPTAGAATNAPLGVTTAAPNSAQIASDSPKVLELKIDASKTTEVRVAGDGKILFKGRLHADDSKHFEARKGFEVTSGDSSAVQLALNGQKVLLTGKPGKKGSAKLSRKDLKPATTETH